MLQRAIGSVALEVFFVVCKTEVITLGFLLNASKKPYVGRKTSDEL